MKDINEDCPDCGGEEKEYVDYLCRTCFDRMRDASIPQLQKRIHQTAVDHGWWECATCNGEDEIPWQDATLWKTAPCPTCTKTPGKHRNPAELLALVHSEVSEALEALRKPGDGHLCDKCIGGRVDTGRPIQGASYLGGSPPTHWEDCKKCGGTGQALGGSRFAEELADVVIRVLDIAEGHSIDLLPVIEAKMAYNDTRSHKHGNKAF